MNLNLQANACDPDRLESFLSGALSNADEREFTLHLNTCENCRRSLQQQAAEPEAWMEAEKLLKPAPFDVPAIDESADPDKLQNSTRPPLQIQNVLATLGPTDDPQMLGRLGGYEISGVVGAGGMGVVLKAIDKSLDRTVAIKVLAPHLATSGAARKRFAREAKAAAAVLHPNVIAIHSVSNDESLPYLVMPYVRGTSLQRRLDREGSLSLQEVLRIGSQIAAGLAAAHAQGLVHRDIKPANILLEDGVERVTITDFGLARAVDDATITHSGVIAGTPQYMSPEQARGEAVDGRSDLFSLGSVLYAVCTGRPPFRAETTYGVMRRITDDEPTSIRGINPEIPEWLCSIIARLMSKRAADRFASAAEVSDLLEKCLAHVQQPAAVPLPASLVTPSKASRFFSISRRSLGVIAMIAAFGLSLLGMFLWQSADPPDISGQWTGEGWGQVELKKQDDGAYDGTYNDTFGKEVGKLQLQWSRMERRFNGKWQEGKDRFGKISVRLVDDEIRGAWTTNEKSRINPGSPELADLLWLRPTTIRTADKLPGIHIRLLLSAETHSHEMMRKNKGFDGLSIMGTGFTATKDGKTYNNVVAVVAHSCRLESFEEAEYRGKKYWDAKFFVPQSPTRDELNPSFLQRELDVFKKEGVEFQLDHYRGQIPQIPKESGIAYVPRSNPDSVDAKAASEPKATSAAPKRLHQFPTGDTVKAIAVSPDGKLIAIANGNSSFPLKDGWKRTVEILDAENGKTVVSLQLTTKEEDEILAAAEGLPHFEVGPLAFSPDGNTLAVGTGMGQVKLYATSLVTGFLGLSLDDEPAKLAEKKTPEKLKSLKRAMGSVTSLAFSPDGSLLAMCGESFDDVPLVFDGIQRTRRKVTGPGRLKVWEVKTGRLKHDLVGHSHANAVSFSPDGNLLASAGRWDDGNGVIVWNTQTGKKVSTIAIEANGGTHAVVFSPTNKLVAIGSLHFDKEEDTSSTSVSVAYALSGITEWKQTIAAWTKPVAFTPDGKSVAVLCGGQSIRFIETKTGTVKHEIKCADFLPAKPRQGAQWTEFAVANQVPTLVIGGVDKERKGSIEVWDLGGPGAAANAGLAKERESQDGKRGANQ
ncbi:MAG: protein kinase domain-containing protein [Pirellulaceae bacterium]